MLFRSSIRASIAETDRLAKLANGLLLLARIDASQLKLTAEGFRLDELLADCAQLIHSIAAKKDVDIRVNIGEPLEIVGDREKLKSVFLNLFENAVKYSGKGMAIAVTLGRKEGDAGTAVVTVEDHGAGIPKAALPHIFKRFYRVDSSRSEGEGHGLGLAIVERLVGLHGGNVSVKSEAGAGSTFTVELPVNRPE